MFQTEFKNIKIEIQTDGYDYHHHHHHHQFIIIIIIYVPRTQVHQICE